MSESFVHLAKTASQSEDYLKGLVAKSLRGLKSGHSPTLCESGVGGTYFMHDESNRTIGVFKPHDEEMWCMNNPKGFTPKTPSFKDYNVSRGAEAGEAAFREYAAYLLDHDNFSGVPATGLVVCSHPSFSSGSSFNGDVKIGSFQEFKEHDFDAEDISSMKYQTFPVHEVHKIAILDIRLLNTDRHGGNILVKANRSRANSRDDVLSDYDSDDDFPAHRRRRSGADESEMMFRMDMDVDDDDYKEQEYYTYTSPISSPTNVEYELIPIDHGYTLPSTVSGFNDLWFEWLKWPQAKVPFGPEAQRYIDRLNPDADVNILRHKFGDLIGSECFKVLRITTMWLKIASRAGLTPYTIGYALCRKSPDALSTLEKMCLEAQQLADKQMVEAGTAPIPPPRTSTPNNTPSSKSSPHALLLPSRASPFQPSSSHNDLPAPLQTNSSGSSIRDTEEQPISHPLHKPNNVDNNNNSSDPDADNNDDGEGMVPEGASYLMSAGECAFFEHLRTVMERSASDLLRSQQSSSSSRPPTTSPRILRK